MPSEVAGLRGVEAELEVGCIEIGYCLNGGRALVLQQLACRLGEFAALVGLVLSCVASVEADLGWGASTLFCVCNGLLAYPP